MTASTGSVPAPDPTSTQRIQPGQPAPTPTPTPTPAPANGVPWKALFVVAVAIGVIYICFAIVTWNRADDADVANESIWSRYVLVLQGIEAIAFTAIGWLFGREVHRGEAESAKQDKVEAERRAETERGRTEQVREEKTEAVLAGQDAESRGRELAESVRATALATAGRTGTGTPDTSHTDGGEELSPVDEDGTRSLPPQGTPGPPEGPVPDHLLALADRLFPPR
jgi:hypothetical protein